MITPNTNIRLLKVPFEIARKNQLTFVNLNAQTNYFLSLPHLEYDNTTYQRQNNVIRFEAPIDDILTYNYVMYKNESYSNKWFYAYITNMEYKNDNTTDITIQTDVFQTWQFDITYNTMFVEREHVNDDTIGAHTIDEDLNVGDVICEYITEDTSLSQYYWVAMQTAWLISDNSTGAVGDLNPGKQYDGIAVYNKQVFGTKIVLFRVNSLADLLNLQMYIYRTNSDGHTEDIQNIFIVPDALITPSALTQHTAYVIQQDNDHAFNFWTMDFSNTIESFNINIDKIVAYYDYTPKNNKCFVFPYNYLYVTNNIGNSNIYKYENFYGVNVKAQFKVELALSVGASGKLVPLNYKRMDRDDDESIPLAKYPTCSWSSDAYVNWLTQNAVNESSRIALGMFGASSNYASMQGNENVQEGAPEIAIGTNIAGSIAQTIGNFYSASLLPNIQGGSNTGDISWGAERNTFTFKCMRVKTENLKVIDEYFSAYGYKVNSVKRPNITGRTNWNYVKTIDCNITGNIPQEDIQELKDMFDNGVTFWHNPSTFLDYSQNNAIVS